MLGKLRKQIAVEREQLNHLLDTHRPLLRKCTTRPPDSIELSALAAMLHAFYTGIENIFKRVAVEVDSSFMRGETWHQELLESMTRPAKFRPAVISQPFKNRLREYLNFRHVFRQAYSFQLRWEKMAPLVLGCEETMQQLEKELDAFLGPTGVKENP